MKLRERFTKAYQAFTTTAKREPDYWPIANVGRQRLPSGVGYTKYTVIAPILNQIAIDVSKVTLRHVILEDEKYSDDAKSSLNDCLRLSPNLDQSPSYFMQDLTLTILEEGYAAVVPVETNSPNLWDDNPFDVSELRVGRIDTWYPREVLLDVYNIESGQREKLLLPKKSVPIITNPMFKVFNEENGTLHRLMKKLSQLDATDDRIASGKLDVILGLPYAVKHQTKREEAERRRKDLEEQLANSSYGVAWTDSLEKVVQLNRPVENQLLAQVQMLEERLYTQLGLTKEVFFGSADESTMLNYYNRTIFPIVRAIQEEMNRKFIDHSKVGSATKTESIMFFSNPFELVPVTKVAEIADKLTRNEIMAPNEVRPIIGLKPVKDPEADRLRNRNMPDVDAAAKKSEPAPKLEPKETDETGL